MADQRLAVAGGLQVVARPALELELARLRLLPPVEDDRVRRLHLGDLPGHGALARLVDERRTDGGLAGGGLPGVLEHASRAGHPVVVPLDVDEPCEHLVDRCPDRALELELDGLHGASILARWMHRNAPSCVKAAGVARRQLVGGDGWPHGTRSATRSRGTQPPIQTPATSEHQAQRRLRTPSLGDRVSTEDTR